MKIYFCVPNPELVKIKYLPRKGEIVFYANEKWGVTDVCHWMNESKITINLCPERYLNKDQLSNI